MSVTGTWAGRDGVSCSSEKVSVDGYSAPTRPCRGFLLRDAEQRSRDENWGTAQVPLETTRLLNRQGKVVSFPHIVRWLLGLSGFNSASRDAVSFG